MYDVFADSKEIEFSLELLLLLALPKNGGDVDDGEEVDVLREQLFSSA